MTPGYKRHLFKRNSFIRDFLGLFRFRFETLDITELVIRGYPKILMYHKTNNKEKSVGNKATSQDTLNFYVFKEFIKIVPVNTNKIPRSMNDYTNHWMYTNLLLKILKSLRNWMIFYEN